jgi:hypothetical protein
MSRKLNCDPAFAAAVRRLVQHGGGKPLVTMLFAGHPNTDDEWLLLAAYLRGDFDKRPGRPADDAVNRAADLYPKVKRDLHQFVQETGARMRTGRKADAAIACTLAYLRDCGYAVPERGKLRNKLKRSKKPRIKR